MTIRETTIAKLQQLPESLLPEVNDFIDFVAHKHQSRTGTLSLKVMLLKLGKDGLRQSIS